MVRVRFGISTEDHDYIQYFNTEAEADAAMDDWIKQDNAWACGVTVTQ